jgi:hypothetical protein
VRLVPFTQYLRPNGRKASVGIERPDDIADKADEIIAKGFRFECEELTTGHVSFTVADDDGDVGIEICWNGVDVPTAVDKLINRVHKELCETHTPIEQGRAIWRFDDDKEEK